VVPKQELFANRGVKVCRHLQIATTYNKFIKIADMVDLVEISDDATKYINPCICGSVPKMSVRKGSKLEINNKYNKI
jgi:hypothetical protein